jgi:hypothetical protein
MLPTDFFCFNLMLFVTQGDQIGSPRARLGYPSSLLWLKANWHYKAAHGALVEMQYHPTPRATNVPFTPALEQVNHLVGLLRQVGFPHCTPQIENDPCSTADHWTNCRLQFQLCFPNYAEPAVDYSLEIVSAGEGEDLANLRAVFRFLYRLAGNPTSCPL